MKTITQKEWEARKRHGYASHIDGHPYTLWLNEKTGGTELVPVRILTAPEERLLSALRKEYTWRKKRYSESETGIRSHGGNCFDEKGAAERLSRLEEEAETQGLDYRAIRNEVYD